MAQMDKVRLLSRSPQLGLSLLKLLKLECHPPIHWHAVATGYYARVTITDAANSDGYLEAGNVIYYNSLQVFQSYRQVYCSSNSFELALRICKERPYVRDLDRKRVEIQ